MSLGNGLISRTRERYKNIPNLIVGCAHVVEQKIGGHLHVVEHKIGSIIGDVPLKNSIVLEKKAIFGRKCVGTNNKPRAQRLCWALYLGKPNTSFFVHFFPCDYNNKIHGDQKCPCYRICP